MNLIESLTLLIIIGIFIYIIIILCLPISYVPKNSLEKYFHELYPHMNVSKYNKLEPMYLNLDCWYTKMFPRYEKQILNKLPNFKVNRMNNLFNQQPDKWERLFDGSVCDCLRFAFPECQNPSSRFTGNKDIIKQCPLWSGINVGITYQTIIKRAYNTNNTDTNFIGDNSFILKKYGMEEQNGKGFPNNSWVEVLTYPGEYGYPNVCIPNDKFSNEIQPGLTYYEKKGNSWDWKNGKKLNIKWSDGPYFNSPAKKGNCNFDFLEPVYIKSDGQFPSNYKTEGEFCISKDVIGKNNNSLQSVPVVRPDIIKDYHGLWLYPLKGVGMWRNLGKSLVCNTKLGFLLTSKPHGPGYNIRDKDIKKVLDFAKHGGASTNINRQIKLLTECIHTGESYISKTRGTLNINELKNHGYNEGRKINKDDAENAALDLVSKWYISGYSGLGKGKGQVTNGFNYNYEKNFPIGVYFSYASSFDDLVLNVLIDMKVDTLQLVMEPQNSKAALTPAYMFEIFDVTPKKLGTYTIVKDTTLIQCKEYYSINPEDDYENYSKYGYVSGDKVKEPKVFDFKNFKLLMNRPSFQP
jgi:hypothetical protein